MGVETSKRASKHPTTSENVLTQVETSAYDKFLNFKMPYRDPAGIGKWLFLPLLSFHSLHQNLAAKGVDHRTIYLSELLYILPKQP